MSQNWRQCEICIVINSKSLDSQPGIYVMMGYFITNLSINLLVKGVFKIDEHLTKLQAKWLVVSNTPFACPQICKLDHQISKITCVLRADTVTDCCYVNRQINVSSLSTNIKLL